MPESGNVDVSLADIYLNMKNYNQSEKYANIAISKDSGIYEAYMILADINQKEASSNKLNLWTYKRKLIVEIFMENNSMTLLHRETKSKLKQINFCQS